MPLSSSEKGVTIKRPAPDLMQEESQQKSKSPVSDHSRGNPKFTTPNATKLSRLSPLESPLADGDPYTTDHVIWAMSPALEKIRAGNLLGETRMTGDDQVGRWFSPETVLTSLHALARRTE